MALEFLDEVYGVAKLIFKMKKCVECCNCSDVWQVSEKWNDSANEIRDLYNNAYDNNIALATEIKGIVDDVRAEINNPLLCGSIIEDRFIPLLYRVAESMGQIDVEENGYHFISSKSGLITMQNMETKMYLYSPIDPLKEAWDKSTSLYTPNAKNIVIMGCGLGYLAYQLWEKSFNSAHVYVLEHDSNMINYAREFGVLDWISPEYLTIVMEEDIDLLFTKFATFEVDPSESILFISDWEMDYADDRLKQKIFDYTENQKASVRYSLRFDVNYYHNISHFAGTIADLKREQEKKVKDKQYIMVAAGPSLNKQMDYLREMQDKKTIVAVDAVLKKLLANNIRPDYVTALDPNKSLMHYLEGIEEQTNDIPLIADSVTYWRYVKNYQGPIYRVVSSDSKLNVNDRDAMGIPDLGYHGTVSGLAIEEAVYFGAETIELVGLDLAFPGGKHHADGLGIDTTSNMRTELMVTSVNGDSVETNQTFEKFIREIEIQVDSHKEVVFINRSDVGAYIKGTFCGRWYEKIPASCDAKDYFDRLAKETMLSWKEKYYIVRQYNNKLISEGFGDEKEIVESSIFDKVYHNITEGFLHEIRLCADENKNETNKFVLLIVSHYNSNDSVTMKMLRDAEQFQTKLGYNVIIINTNEYLGGTRIAIDQSIDEMENETILNESIVYMGHRYPYILCNISMPDIEYIEKVCGTLSTYNIGGIITYDSMSLFAESCKKIGLVEYRFGELKDNCDDGNIAISDKAQFFFKYLLRTLNDKEDSWFNVGSPILEELDKSEYSEKDLNDIRRMVNGLLSESCDKNDIRTVVFCYSFLYKFDSDRDVLENFLDYLIGLADIDYLKMHFIFQQIVYSLFTNSELKNASIEIKMQKFLEKCVDSMISVLPEEVLDPVNREEKDDDLVIVLTSQFLDIEHGPTKSALDRCCIVLNELKKKVMLINTAELLQINGRTPFYGMAMSNYISANTDLDAVEWKGCRIPFYQMKYGMPELALFMEALVAIKSSNPAYIIEIGASSMLASVLSKFIPVMSDSMVPSSIGYFCTQAITCSKSLTEYDRKVLMECNIDEDRIIKSIFTMKIKPSVEHHSRQEYGLPEDAFCVAVVGARLDNELSDEFLTFMEDNIIDNLCYVLLGVCRTFEDKVNQHPKLKDHIYFLGFVKDTQSYLHLCNAYLNPPRTGGGFSATEAMMSGLPPITLAYGDVSIAAGNEFCCENLEEMSKRIVRYMDDKEYYENMAAKARERGEILQDSERFFVETLETFVDRFVK